MIKKKKVNLKSIFSLIFFLNIILLAQSNEDCFDCHNDKTLEGTISGKTFSAYVNQNSFNNSVHTKLNCVDCHEDIDLDEHPDETPAEKVNCGSCHKVENDAFYEGIHGKAVVRNDPLAPTCVFCHGNHYIKPPSNLQSETAPLQIPSLCGRCHREGTKVQLQRRIPKDRILENYSLSIHGDGLLKKGLIVSATCVSCHSSHKILPPENPNSTIARNNISKTCSVCHADIETVHRKIIKGKLWEKQAHVLPVCVDCHQPHKIRNTFYEQGMANKDCLKCHSKKNIVASNDGRSLYVDFVKIEGSKHNKIACSQCHTEVNASKVRACQTIKNKVDCSSCHSEIGDNYNKSIHGKLFAEKNENAPTCKECHGQHNVLGRKNPKSNTFPTNIPTLCARCHRTGEKAANRYTGTETNIIEHYIQSIHGKGLMKSGLTVTATCTDCHTAHLELPHEDPESSINQKNIANTCGSCHYGIEEQFNKSIHSQLVNKTDKKLPVCNDCHSAHTIKRTDNSGFKLEIMSQCGNCHKKIAETYFDTYHGKVSQLGYTKTAKCYDCHGSHDILKVTDPISHLSRGNITRTCQKCHPSATRKFAGYFTHATHHDPEKYPFLFWTFWGMTGLLIFTFLFFGIHTLLWLPRSLKWRKVLKQKLGNNTQDKNEQ